MEHFLVTGALGCIGAWVLAQLHGEGVPVTGFDLGTDRARVATLLGEEAAAGLDLVQGDVTDLVALERVLDERPVTNVVHLAALQVPFCRERPALGAAVNVVGTVNVFEAVTARRERIPRVTYASSAAVYGPTDTGAADERTRPDTHYGVYKVANEGSARIYWQDGGLPSVGIRPYTVFGPARDQGVTSAPTLAMEAAARGEPFHIPWGGTSQYHFARDVAAAFVHAGRADADGARVYNLAGDVLTMGEVVAAIERVVPESAGTITYDDVQLPFPPSIEATALEEELGPYARTSFEEGVRETVEHERSLHT